MQQDVIAARRASLGSLRISRRHLVAAGAAIILLAAAVAVILGLSGGGSSRLVIPIPGHPTALAVSDDVVWVTAAGSQAAWPIDARTGRQAGPGIRTGGAPSRLAAGAHGLWIADSARAAVIPVQERPQRVFDGLPAGADITDVALAAGAVWVASSAEGVVRAIEPGGRNVETLPVGAEPVDLTAGGRWVVVVGARGTLVRIDARQRQAVGAPVVLGGVPVAAALSGDTAWVADASGGTVTKVDLRTGQVAGPPVEVCRRPIALAAGGADVWVLCSGDRSLVQLDGQGDELSRREVGQDPTALAVDERYVWVAAAGDDTVTRYER